MRLTALFIVLLSLFGLTYLYGLPYAAEKLTIKFLHQTNFQAIKIEGLSASFPAFMLNGSSSIKTDLI